MVGGEGMLVAHGGKWRGRDERSGEGKGRGEERGWEGRGEGREVLAREERGWEVWAGEEKETGGGGGEASGGEVFVFPAPLDVVSEASRAELAPNAMVGVRSPPHSHCRRRAALRPPLLPPEPEGTSRLAARRGRPSPPAAQQPPEESGEFTSWEGESGGQGQE